MEKKKIKYIASSYPPYHKIGRKYHFKNNQEYSCHKPNSDKTQFSSLPPFG